MQNHNASIKCNVKVVLHCTIIEMRRNNGIPFSNSPDKHTPVLSVETPITDEVSMISAKVLQQVEYLCKKAEN